jgi:hypothetical protein
MLLGDVAGLFIPGVPMYEGHIEASTNDQRLLNYSSMGRISFKWWAIAGVSGWLVVVGSVERKLKVD